MIEEIYHKGYKIEIHQDSLSDSPDSWDDDQLFLVYHHRQFTINRKGFDPHQINEHLLAKEPNKENYLDSDEFEMDFNDYAESINLEYNNYWIFPVDAYIHSGVHLSLANARTYPDRSFDVSTTGYCLVKKELQENVEDAYVLAESLIESWNNYLSGEIYGFIIKKLNTIYSISKEKFDKILHFRIVDETELKDIINQFNVEDEWEELNSCWGYYGEKGLENAIEEAKCRIEQEETE